jgi:cytoskeletal protein CcmA (bactofilin family)
MFNRKPVSGNGGLDPISGEATANRAAPVPSPTQYARSVSDASPAPASSPLADGVVVIGKGTRIVGEITQCAKLEIQGEVEGTVVADQLVVRESGMVKGELQATQAEIHGIVRGRLDVRDVLDVRGTGRVEGDLSYGRLAVAMGGFISGTVSGEAEAAQAETAAADSTARSPFASQTNGSSDLNAAGYTNGAALS